MNYGFGNGNYGFIDGRASPQEILFEKVLPHPISRAVGASPETYHLPGSFRTWLGSPIGVVTTGSFLAIAVIVGSQILKD